jgi:plastocyanin
MSKPLQQRSAYLRAAMLTTVTLGASACGADRDAGVQIGMQHLQFTPRQTTAQVGRRVEWRNHEDVPHNIVATAGARFRSRTIARDGMFTFTPREPGTIRYVCTLHPGMTGTLRVTG